MVIGWELKEVRSEASGGLSHNAVWYIEVLDAVSKPGEGFSKYGFEVWMKVTTIALHLR